MTFPFFCRFSFHPSPVWTGAENTTHVRQPWSWRLLLNVARLFMSSIGPPILVSVVKEAGGKPVFLPFELGFLCVCVLKVRSVPQFPIMPLQTAGAQKIVLPALLGGATVSTAQNPHACRHFLKYGDIAVRTRNLRQKKPGSHMITVANQALESKMSSSLTLVATFTLFSVIWPLPMKSLHKFAFSGFRVQNFSVQV